jgi:hypothetical protein
VPHGRALAVVHVARYYQIQVRLICHTTSLVTRKRTCYSVYKRSDMKRDFVP